jgi:Domain of unknown function (DUF4349)
MRRAEPLDPAVLAELQALDAALAGEPGADAELSALVRDVRAVAPAPDPAFRAALDERVRTGFPRPPRRRDAWRARLGVRRALIPAGALAAALLALVVVLGVTSGGDEDRLGDGGGSVSEIAPQARQEAPAGVAAPDVAADDAGAGAAAPSTGAPSTAAPALPAAPASPVRRVERSTRLELGARADRFELVTDRVVRTTQRHGGHVAGSQIGRAGSQGTASFVLRVPTAELDATVADLSRLAHVRSIEQATQDLTGAYDGTTARLRDARTRRRALVAALATAEGATADRLRARLSDATARVRRLERSLAALRARTSLATIDLTVTAAASGAATPPGDDRWTPGDAWRDARRGLEIAAGVLVLALAFLLPLALAGGAATLGARALRRRRRDAALDAA